MAISSMETLPGLYDKAEFPEFKYVQLGAEALLIRLVVKDETNVFDFLTVFLIFCAESNAPPMHPNWRIIDGGALANTGLGICGPDGCNTLWFAANKLCIELAPLVGFNSMHFSAKSLHCIVNVPSSELELLFFCLK